MPVNAEAVHGDAGRIAAVAYDYIEGVPARALGRAARASLAREVGAALTALHAIPVEEARALGVPEVDLGEELYRPMIEACAPHLGPRGRAWLERRFAEFIEGGGSAGAPRVLVHGDLGCGHLLADSSGRLAGIIDWGDALTADPAYDLAALLANCPRGFAERVIDAYEGPAKGDPDMRRRAQIGLNKGESHHALKNALRIGRQGEIRDRSTEGQHYRMAGLNLLAAIVIYWNTVRLGEAVRQRKRAGLPVEPELLAHISPLGWGHILLTGEYRWPKRR